MRDERMTFIGTRPYLNNHCLSGIARRSCDSNCSPSTVQLTCRINRNWGWTGNQWAVILAKPWLMNTLLPVNCLKFIQKSSLKKPCVRIPISCGPWKNTDARIDLFKRLNYIRLQLIPEGSFQNEPSRSRATSHASLGQSASWFVPLEDWEVLLLTAQDLFESWITRTSWKEQLCIPGAASMIIKSLEPSGTNASASIWAVSGCLRKVRNRCASAIAKYWRHLSIGGKFSFDTLNAAWSASVSWVFDIRLRLTLTGLTISTPSTFVREARRFTGLTGMVASLDECEERIVVLEKKWRWKAPV